MEQEISQGHFMVALQHICIHVVVEQQVLCPASDTHTKQRSQTGELAYLIQSGSSEGRMAAELSGTI